AGVALVAAFRDAAPAFAWRDPPYEYEHTKLPFDILAGASTVREQIEAGVDAETIARSWEAPVAEFNRIRARLLIYLGAERRRRGRGRRRRTMRALPLNDDLGERLPEGECGACGAGQHRQHEPRRRPDADQSLLTMIGTPFTARSAARLSRRRASGHD